MTVTPEVQNGNVPAGRTSRQSRRAQAQPTVIRDEDNLKVSFTGTHVTVEFDVSDEAMAEYGWESKNGKSNVFASTGYGLELPGLAAFMCTVYRTKENQYLHDNGMVPEPKVRASQARSAPVTYRP